MPTYSDRGRIGPELLTLERNLCTPHLSSNDPLIQILDGAYQNHGVERKTNIEPKIHWSAEKFKLNQSPIFNHLSIEIRDQILVNISGINLALSYFIEKSGINYAAKMMLLSESVEEKSLYSLFASEESLHLREFMNYLWYTPDLKKDFHPMLPILSDAIEFGSRDALVFVVQVLLEGFGISHYSHLKENCLDPNLKNAFQMILKDEARHHGAGLVLTKTRPINRNTEDEIFELSRRFIRAMQTGRYGQIFRESGAPLTQAQEQKLWDDIRFEETLATRMLRLQEMFQKVSYQNIFERLKNENVFKLQHTV